MQGTLREIDVHSLLKLIELGQRTGELSIESNAGQVWFLFFTNGEIVYATEPASNLTRLKDYLCGLHLERALEQTAAPNLGINILEYGQLWALISAQILTPVQARKLLRIAIEEVLFDILDLHEGTFAFELSPPLSPQLCAFKYTTLATTLLPQLHTWKQFYPRIKSPEQCPILLSEGALPHLSQWIDGHTTLRQLARYTGRSLSAIAQATYMAVRDGTAALRPLPPPADSTNTTDNRKAQRVVCVDDSMTICRAVEYILLSNGYQVTAISNPIRALSLIFQLKPDIILCDIAMPELDGYELCSMFRHSTAFAQTPIVMLTARGGFIDRVKARIAGATEYLTKPFGEKELLTIVEKCSERLSHHFSDNGIPHRGTLNPGNTSG